MRVIRHVAHVGPAARPGVVAAGEFNGVHCGHQRVLAGVVARAHAIDGEPAVIVVRTSRATTHLTDLRQQLELLGAAGIGVVLFSPATDLPAALRRLGAAVYLTAGADIGVPKGVSLERVARVELDGAPVTAQRVGVALSRGDLDAARALLGRDPGIGGRVVHGFHRGARLGIPTANLRVRGVQLPPDGVYAVRARVGATALRGVANIGFNPTFGNRTRSVETHLFDFDGDLYGRRLDVAFVARLRGEQTFADVPALLAQIHSDIAAARRLLEPHGG
jgi:riboflavin kinase / FMN adenylyltransferase